MGTENDDLRLFVPITKIDEEKRLVYGRITEERLDKTGEVFDYASSKPFFEAWSSEIEKATDGKSKGNVRVMHQPKVAGVIKELHYDDAAKAIDCLAHVVDEDEWKMCLAGAYTGFSQGGRYVRRWDDGGVKRFTAQPSEVSLVDNPAVSTAHFQLVKADGTMLDVPFKKQDGEEPKKEPPNTAPEQKQETETPPNTGEPAEDREEKAYVARMAKLGVDHSEPATRELIRQNNARIGQGV